VIEARAFAAAYRVWDSAKDKKDVPSSPMVDLVIETAMEAEAEQYRARQARETEGLSGDDD